MELCVSISWLKFGGCHAVLPEWDLTSVSLCGEHMCAVICIGYVGRHVLVLMYVFLRVCMRASICVCTYICVCVCVCSCLGAILRTFLLPVSSSALQADAEAAVEELNGKNLCGRPLLLEISQKKGFKGPSSSSRPPPQAPDTIDSTTSSSLEPPKSSDGSSSKQEVVTSSLRTVEPSELEETVAEVKIPEKDTIQQPELSPESLRALEEKRERRKKEKALRQEKKRLWKEEKQRKQKERELAQQQQKQKF